MLKEKINALIEEKKEELFSLLGALIKINSESFGHSGNEAEVAEYIAKCFSEMGLFAEVYSPLSLAGFSEHPDHFAGRGLENRYNATVRWRGRKDEDALMLMAHSDTEVIGDEKRWTVPPLCGEVRDGKIWGRGACDDKYATATVLFLVKLLRENGFVPEKNLLFTAYCDEEKGGSNGALAAMLKYPCEKTVNMDCKSFEIWNAAAGGGIAAYRYHTARPTDSAYRAATAIPVVMAELSSFGERRKAELLQNEHFKDTVIPHTALRYMGVWAGDNGADLGQGEVSFNYYTDRGRKEIFGELAEVHERIAPRLAEMGIVGDGFTQVTRFFHYGAVAADGALVSALQRAAREAVGRELHSCGSCISDLSIIQKYAGGEAVAFGIGRPFGEQGGAHQPDEYIDCESLVEYAKIMAHYLLNELGSEKEVKI